MHFVQTAASAEHSMQPVDAHGVQSPLPSGSRAYPFLSSHPSVSQSGPAVEQVRQPVLH